MITKEQFAKSIKISLYGSCDPASSNYIGNYQDWLDRIYSMYCQNPDIDMYYGLSFNLYPKNSPVMPSLLNNLAGYYIDNQIYLNITNTNPQYLAHALSHELAHAIIARTLVFTNMRLKEIFMWFINYNSQGITDTTNEGERIAEDYMYFFGADYARYTYSDGSQGTFHPSYMYFLKSLFTISQFLRKMGHYDDIDIIANNDFKWKVEIDGYSYIIVEE